MARRCRPPTSGGAVGGRLAAGRTQRGAEGALDSADGLAWFPSPSHPLREAAGAGVRATRPDLTIVLDWSYIPPVIPVPSPSTSTDPGISAQGFAGSSHELLARMEQDGAPALLIMLIRRLIALIAQLLGAAASPGTQPGHLDRPTPPAPTPTDAARRPGSGLRSERRRRATRVHQPGLPGPSTRQRPPRPGVAGPEPVSVASEGPGRGRAIRPLERRRTGRRSARFSTPILLL